MPTLKKLEKPRQLLVMGVSALYFFEAFLKHLNIEDVQIHNYGGVDELKEYVSGLVRMPGFAERVVYLGIIRDGDNNPKGAFESVRSTLLKYNLPVPDSPEELSPEGKLRTSIFILPGGGNRGMLETICLSASRDDPAMSCIEQYFACLNRKKIRVKKAHLDKARVQAFLASRERPGLLLGQGARAGFWDFDHPCFEPLKQFLLTQGGSHKPTKMERTIRMGSLK